MPDSARVQGEAEVVAALAPLAAAFPGAQGLSDDCAVLSPEPGMDLVLKTDAIAEGVHFLADDDPADIGWKALAVNVSDLAAKAAVPRVYLMALSFPDAPERAWLARFAHGLSEAQAAFGIHLAGGDTDRRPGPLAIALTVIGAVPQGRVVRRGSAKPGDRLFVSGTLGDAALGLKLRQDRALANPWRLGTDQADWLVTRYLRPQPRLALRQALIEHARAAMDLSDGLAKDLGRMAQASGVGAVVEAARLPLSDPARAAMAVDPLLLELAIASGDDYEILAAVAPDQAADFSRAAAAAGVAVTEIGTINAAGDVAVLDAAGARMTIARAGWDHF